LNDWTTYGYGDASWIEIAWTGIALIGLSIALYAFWLALGDYDKVREGKFNSLIEAVSIDNMISTVIHSLIQLGFAGLGILHIMIPVNIESSNLFRISIGIIMWCLELGIFIAMLSSLGIRRYLLQEMAKQ